MSYIQIYNEKIQDLLAPNNDNLALREHEDGVFIQDLSSKQIRNIREAAHLIAFGDSNRITALTKMNAHSSRAHSCLMVSLERRTKIVSDSSLADTRSVLKGRLYLVDLCGSERLKKTEATGLRKTEANFINLSLSTLGQVMHALESQKDFVPFRNSKLTRLLQESLSGKGKSSIIVCIGPSSDHMQESISSLQFGSRAMKVKTNAQAFKDVDYKALSIKLQQELDAAQEKYRELEDILDEEMKESERLERNLQRKTEKLNQSKERMQQIMSTREDDLGKLESEYEVNLANLEAQIEEKDNDIDQLKDACEAMKVEQERLAQLNDESAQIIQSLREENHQLRDNVERTNEEMNQLLVDTEQKQTDLEEYMEYSEQKIASQDKKIEKRKEKIAVLKEHVKTVEQKHSDEIRLYSTQIAKLDKQILGLKDELRDFENVKRQLEQRENEFRVTQSALQEARNALAVALVEKDDIYANISAFQEKLMTAESEIEQHKHTLEETVSQLNNTKEEADKIKQETTKKDQFMQDMHERIRQAQHELETTTAELRLNSEKLSRQESSAAKAHSQNTILEKQLMTIETKMRSIELTLEKSRRQNATLLDEIESERQRCAAFQTVLSRERNTKEAVMEELEQLQLRFDASQEETYLVHRENESLSVLVSRYENQMQRMQKQLQRVVRHSATVPSTSTQGGTASNGEESHDQMASTTDGHADSVQQHHLLPDPIEEQIKRQNEMRLSLIQEKFKKNEAKHLELLHASQQERIRRLIQQKEDALRELLESDSNLDDDTKRQLLNKHRHEVEQLQASQKEASQDQLETAASKLRSELQQELKNCEQLCKAKVERYRKLRQDYEERLAQLGRSASFEEFQKKTQHETQAQLLALHEEKNTYFESIIEHCSKADPSSIEEQIMECKALYARKHQDLQERMQAKVDLFLQEEKKVLANQYLEEIRSLDESLTAFSEGTLEFTELSEESVLPMGSGADITDQLSSTIASLTERLHVVEKELQQTEQKYIQATIEKAEYEAKIQKINATLELVRQSSQNLEECTATSVANLYSALRSIVQLESKLEYMQPAEITRSLRRYQKQIIGDVTEDIEDPIGEDISQDDNALHTLLQESGLFDLDLPQPKTDAATRILNLLTNKYENQLHDKNGLRDVALRLSNISSQSADDSSILELAKLLTAQENVSSSIVSAVHGLTFDGLMNFVWRSSEHMDQPTEQEAFSHIVNRLCADYTMHKMLLRRGFYMFQKQILELRNERQRASFLRAVAESTTLYLMEKLHEKQSNLVLCAEELARVNETLIQLKIEKDRERSALMLQSSFRRIKLERMLREQKEETENVVRENVLKRKFIDALKRSRGELKQQRDEYKSSLNEHSSKTGALLIKQSLLDVTSFWAECQSSLFQIPASGPGLPTNPSPRAGLRRGDSFNVGRSRATSNASVSSVDSSY